MLYDTAADADVAKSYYNVNGSYLGYTKRTRQLQINNAYNPMNMSNRILVNPGTQTSNIDINFSDGGFLAAKKLVLSPSTNSHTSDSGKLTFSSVDDGFTLVYEESEIEFRVGAAIDLAQGLYWIDWSLDETKSANGTDTQYDPPSKTLVEVTDGSSKVSFTVPDVPTIGVGNKTRHLCITTTNAPHTEVTIDLALANADVTGVKFSPNSLKFSPNVNERCFRVQV